MGVIPSALKALTIELQRLPGIGPKSARRLAYFLFSLPQEKLDYLGESIGRLKEKITICNFCKTLSDTNPCELCADTTREQHKICVVADYMDVYAIERAGSYKGCYFVLGSLISPVKGLGVASIRADDLVIRIKQLQKLTEAKVEVILAISPTTEGQTTVLYIKEFLSERFGKDGLILTRVAVGLAVGADIDYVDTYTLQEALKGRTDV